jgi:hypothetical protein
VGETARRPLIDANGSTVAAWRPVCNRRWRDFYAILCKDSCRREHAVFFNQRMTGNLLNV